MGERACGALVRMGPAIFVRLLSKEERMVLEKNLQN
jgi:hypothetical protein